MDEPDPISNHYVNKVLITTNKYEAPIPYRIAKLASVSGSGGTEEKLSESFLASSEKWRTKQRLASELKLLMKESEDDGQRRKVERILQDFPINPTLEKLLARQRKRGAIIDEKSPFGRNDTFMNNVNEVLHETQKLEKMEHASRTMVHPFTHVPLVTATTGPAAPPEVRIENDKKQAKHLALHKGEAGVEGREEEHYMSPPSSPTMARSRGASPTREPSSPTPEVDSPPADSLPSPMKHSVPAGSAANLAFSLRPPKVKPELLNPDVLDKLSPEELFRTLNDQGDMQVTKFRLQNDMQRSSSSVVGRAATANSFFSSAPPLMEEEGGKEASNTIVDRVDTRDELFAKLMGEEAELDARPKTSQETKKNTSSRSLRPAAKASAALPALQMQIRTKVNVTLDDIGHVRTSTSEMVSLLEPEQMSNNLEDLRLKTVGKCKYSDPYPLMPMCQVPLLYYNQSAEPVRDRDKDWHLDSERKFLGDDVDVSVGRIKAEKDNLKAARLQGVDYDFKPALGAGNYPNMGHDTRELVYSDEAGYLISRELLWRGAVLVSRSYCVMSAFGMGIAGRVHAVGLHIPRYVLLECYTRENSASHQIWVSMEMLEKLFDDRPEMLKPGMKNQMIFELCRMCFFEYHIHEQYVNAPGADASERADELPPKVTKYRHNEKWHIDAVEDETEQADSDDEEDLAMAKKKSLRRASVAASEKPSASVAEEEKKEDGGGEVEAVDGDGGGDGSGDGGGDDGNKGVVTTTPEKIVPRKSKKVSVRTMKRSPHARKDSSPERDPNSSPLASAKSPQKVILNEDGNPGKPGERTNVWQVKKTWNVEYLKISKGRKLSAADVRRVELRRKRAEEAAAAEAARMAWLRMPRRMRGLVVGTAVKISGYLVNVMVYEFKQQPGMYLTRIHDIFHGQVYELKISASVLGKLLKVKRKSIRWKPEQKKAAIINWLVGYSKAPLAEAIAGRPELVQVSDPLTGEKRTRLDWTAGQRFGVMGKYIPRNSLRYRKRVKTFVQPKMNCAVGLEELYAMAKEEEKEMTLKKKEETAVVDLATVERRLALEEELEKRRLKEEEEKAKAAAAAAANRFVSYANSTKDFHKWRKGDEGAAYELNVAGVQMGRTMETVHGEDVGFWGRNCLHVNLYCPRNFVGRCTSLLGLGHVRDHERKGRPVFRVGCKPRREVGNGKRMCGGVAKVDGLRGIFELYRSGTGNNWGCGDGGGDEVRLTFSLVSEVVGSKNKRKFKGKLTTNSTFMLRLTVDDCFRVCQGTDWMELAKLGDDEELEMQKANQTERMKELKDEEGKALEKCKEEMAKAKKMAAKLRLEHKDKAEKDFREAKERIKKEKQEMRNVLATIVGKAEDSWRMVGVKLLENCTWFEVFPDERIYVGGKLEQSAVGLPCILAEKVIGGGGGHQEAQQEEQQEEQQAVNSYYTLKLNCQVYQSVHKINSKSKYRDKYRTLMFTVSQERKRLRFIGYDFETSDYFVFSYSEAEQEEMVKFQRELGKKEIEYQFSSAFLNAQYEDDGTYFGTKKRKFVVKFVGEVEADGLDIHMTADEERRAAANLDAMMAETTERAKSRQEAARHKLEDEEEVGWGAVEVDD
ncbi:hypothetical protein TrRE_jg12681 [Triparma retinervis]|uniref:Uncharacterized protein n=1 Tax=Triparma retinervis TaxID=2557542 RepID=A0A9W7AJS1_9STRA|nr:hypothetical protein TrRE_jg12681 [Triparma retinervis]